MDNLVLLLLAVNAVTFLGGFAKGLSGFGAPLVMVPLFALWLPLPVAVPLTVLIGIVATLPMLRVVRKHIRWGREIYTAIIFSTGAALGVQLLVIVPEAQLRLLLGTVLLLFVAYMFVRGPAPSVAPAWSVREGGLLGGAAAIQGVLSGAVGGGALPLVPYLALRYPPSDARAIFVVVFSLGTIVQASGYALVGLIDLALLGTAAISLPGLGIGLLLGTWLHTRVQPAMFARVIALLLLLPAINMIGLF